MATSKTNSKSELSLNFPKKDEKYKGVLLNCLRILSWEQFKYENKDLELAEDEKLYDKFKELWFAHEIHKSSLTEIQKFIEELGYTEGELIQHKNEYYQKQNAYNDKANGNGNGNGNSSEIDKTDNSVKTKDNVPF